MLLGQSLERSPDVVVVLPRYGANVERGVGGFRHHVELRFAPRRRAQDRWSKPGET